jgi:general secretion pathway protein E
MNKLHAASENQNSAFLEHLQAAGALDDVGVQRVHSILQSSRQTIDTVLLELGLVPESRLADEQALFLGLDRVHPRDFPDDLPPESELPRGYVRSSGLLPIVQPDSGLSVITSRPFEIDAIQGLGYALARKPVAKVAAATELAQHIEKLLDAENPAQRDVSSGVADAQEDDVERLKDFAREAPIIKQLNRIISAAVQRQASDIHLEPLDDHVQVRYRIDGTLLVAERLPKNIQNGLVSRVKILAKLNIAEQRLPQDGRIRIPVRGRDIEFRVSTAPVVFGESVALRVLDRQQLPLRFRELGFSESETLKLNALTNRPNGIVLVTGPTGSGKTTTLYAALNALNKPETKVFTVEDPVEYHLKGVNQINVKPAIGLDFSAVLRSILRQDPDIIMIGEIRDLETARIAVQASLTGHFVLSTLHTNSAVASITRLLDMGLEDYLLASCLRGIVAQRLLRKLCSNCKSPMPLSAGMSTRLGIPRDAKTCQAVGCDVCKGTGYHGRTVVAEILEVTPEQRDAIIRRAPETEFEALAVKAGMRSLFARSLEHVASGETSLDEVYRVIQGPAEAD